MHGVILTFHVIIALFLILVILAQQRGGGLSSLWGGESIFGSRGANPFLTKTTVVLFVLFIITSITLSLVGGRRMKRETSAVRRAIESEELDRRIRE